MTLLCDPYPLVRVIAVQGVCKIIGVYWELLPAATVSSLLAKLIQEEVYDTSSPDVRAAVFKGLKYILDNPLSHPLMKHSLPSLGNFIHDTSEKVIIAFLELLLKVKGIRTIKVSSIVSIEHLLARLEVSSPPLARRLVSLLINSFHPTNQEPDVQIERVIRLIRTNQAACRFFYRHAAQQMSTSDAVEFMLLLCRCIRGCIRAAKAETPPMNASGDSSVTSSEDSKMETQMDKENENEDEDGLSLKDKDVMEGMLEIVAILWTSIGTELSKPANGALKMKLISKYSKALPEFLVTFQEGRSVSAIVVLASYLPASAIPSFSNGCLSSLKSLPVSASHDSYGPLLTCLVSWGRGRDVLELISDWLELTLNPKEDIKEEPEENERSKKSKKRKKHVVFVEPIQPQPLLGIKFLDWLLGQYPSRAQLLQSCSKEMVELMLVLKKVMLSLEKRFLRGSVLSFTTDEVLMKSISAYLRLLIHVQVTFALTSEGGDSKDTVSSGQDFTSHFEDLLAWMSRELVPSLKKPLSESSGTSRGGMDLTLQQLSKDIVQSLLQLFTDGLMLGVGGPQLPDQLAFFCSEVLQSDCGVSFLATSVKVMYHLSNRMLKDYLESPQAESQLQSSVTSLLVTIIKNLSQELENKAKDGSEDEIHQIMSTIKPDVAESLKLCQRHRALCPSLDKNVLSSIMAAVISEMSSTISKNGQVPFDAVDSLALLPPLPAFLLAAVASTNVMVGCFVTELQQCVRSGAIETGAELCAIIHILHALKKDRTNVEGLEKCLLNVETQLNSVEGTLANTAKAAEEDDSVLMERFIMFESRKVLNSLLGKDPPTNPHPAPVTAANVLTESDSSSSSSVSSSLNKSKKKLYNSGSSLLM
ncbi:Condensin-2 complex subunit G2 [Holothuria leucospilota]|uniref:Condensin-2 complex subunit G2 n=1 Tax=Holothuria leucospilota TaxID=206669 RepID=A0A9Q1C1G1_HOLLE|nr:Condensin-2 complex subunit G2 [Holothuria leucospilota]